MKAGGVVRLLLISCLLALVLSGCGPSYQWQGELVEPLEPVAELTGTNWNGERFQLSEVRGKVAVVFFGYTMCPDVCPFTLAKLKQVMKGLGDKADDLAVVFVSVDPHRDSVEVMSRYVPNFDERFYGIALEFDELDQISETWDLTVQYGQPKDGPGTDSFYYVDHTGTYFVIDREGNLRLKFPPNVTPDTMTSDLAALLAL